MQKPMRIVVNDHGVLTLPAYAILDNMLMFPRGTTARLRRCVLSFRRTSRQRSEMFWRSLKTKSTLSLFTATPMQ